MAIYNVDDIVRIRCAGDIYGEPFEHVVHFRIKTSVTTIVTLRDQLNQKFLTAIANFMCAQARYLYFWHKRVRPAPESTEEMVIIDPIPGNIGGTAMPHQMCVLVRHWTIADDGPHHGRIYVPGWPKEQWLSGTYGVSYRSTLLNQMNTLMTLNGRGGTNPVLELGVLWNQADEPNARLFGATDKVEYALWPAVMRSRRPHVS